MAKRERYLFVCINRRPDGHPKGSCAARGSEAIHAALKEQLGAKQMLRTGVRPCTSSCLDACHLGPVIAVEPDGYFYGKVSIDDVPEIVSAFERGTRVERLVIADEDFDEKR